MNITKFFLTQNDCYKQNKKINPSGIIIHSTGANNPYLNRYINPDDGILGQNKYGNHWNKSGYAKCVHAFIGKDKNDKVKIYQTLSWETRPWGCGTGKNGSYNNSHIQFEICEDGLNDKKYFTECINLAVELCAYLCKLYNININNVVDHSEAHKKGYASNHADISHWLSKYSLSMDNIRDNIKTLLSSTDEVNEEKNITKVLRKGDRGSEVKHLQISLNTLLFINLVADGIFGEKTYNAVKNFQQKNGLSVDGIVGEKTQQKIDELLNKKDIFYTVKKGDNFNKISREVFEGKMDINKTVEANRGVYPKISASHIQVGWNLKVVLR